ncbi:MAG: hypothetical protein L6282_06450 [Candidatus Methanoperedenaceae archaeon]|nr:hypothetical protein [Candidatus Methanoperedenaceae archaeon]
MLKNQEISEDIKKVSRNIKIIYFGEIIQKKEDPWEQLTGKITMKRKISVEDMLHSKGFEDAT